MPWFFDPHSGGEKIPDHLFPVLKKKADDFQKSFFPTSKIQLRFRKQFCYVDELNDQEPMPLGRLRYFAPDRWSVAFFTYSNERYQPCILDNGEWFGEFEQAIRVCTSYLC